MAGNTDRYPRFEDLPLRKGDPPFSSWGLWGVDDQVGTIVRMPRLLSPVVISLNFLGNSDKRSL